MTLSISYNRAARGISETVTRNWASKWWLKPDYIEGRYDKDEVRQALDEVLQIFNHEWLERLVEIHGGKVQRSPLS